MKELKAVIKEKPACLTDKRILQGCLMDSGWDQRTVSVLVNLMDGGIVQKIQKNGGGLTQTDIYDLISQLERRYGTSRKFVEEGIRLWTEALGATVPKASSEVKPEQKKNSTQPAVKSAVKTVTLPAEKAPLENHQRSWYKKLVLAVGWLDIFLWIVAILVDCQDLADDRIVQVEMVIFFTILMLPVFLMQRHLWKIGFQRIDASRKVFAVLNFLLYVNGFFVFAVWLCVRISGEVNGPITASELMYPTVWTLYHGLWHFGYRVKRKEKTGCNSDVSKVF